jgi:uncharacterized protein YlxP (DUF503 family)
MVIGICTVELFLPGTASLKDKRRILKSIKDRLRQRFNVSVAEIDEQELWQKSVLGMACVGNEKKFVNQVLDQAMGLIGGTPQVEVVRSRLELT